MPSSRDIAVKSRSSDVGAVRLTGHRVALEQNYRTHAEKAIEAEAQSNRSVEGGRRRAATGSL